MTHKHMMGMLGLLPGTRDNLFFWAVTPKSDNLLMLTSDEVMADRKGGAAPQRGFRTFQYNNRVISAELWTYAVGPASF